MCDISKGVANTLLPKKYFIKKQIDIMYPYREKVAFATHVLYILHYYACPLAINISSFFCTANSTKEMNILFIAN